MVAIVISFFGCGEDEEMPVKPATSDSTPVAVEQTEDNPQPAEIVWIEIEEDGTHKEREEIEFSDQIQKQNVIVVKVKDAKGEPVPNVRVEWILNTRLRAVGDIVDTDDAGHQDVPAAPKPEAAPQIKVDNKFAFTFTNSKDETPPQLKGMGPERTDITIKKGETWIVITSVEEGDTDITAFAPAIPRDGEKPHKIFTIKHWTDICLITPNPQLTCINYCPDRPDDANEEELEANIIGCRDRNPLPGIKVRYTITSGPNAVWDENGEKIIEVISDDNGEAPATIKLVPPLPEPETEPEEIDPNTIKVEAFRPPREDEEDYVLVASQRVTKLWGSAFLSIDMPCPEGSGVNGAFGVCDEVTFDIIVKNTGNCTARDVKVILEYPSEAFDISQPPDPVEYLPPGQSTQVSVTLTTKKVGTWTVKGKTESADCVYAEADTPCSLDVKPNLVLKCEETELMIGDVVQPFVYSDTIILEMDDEAPEKKIARITLIVENKCRYDVIGGYDLTVTLPTMVDYISATPSPAESPPHGESGGKITWNTSIIKPGNNKFTFRIEGTEVETDRITAKLSKVKEPQTCEFPIEVRYVCQLMLTGGAPRRVVVDGPPKQERFVLQFKTTRGKAENVRFVDCAIQKEIPEDVWIYALPDDVGPISVFHQDEGIELPYLIEYEMDIGDTVIFDIVFEVKTTNRYRCELTISYSCGRVGEPEVVVE